MGNTSISPSRFNSLNADKQERILSLRDEHHNLHIISPMFEMGPDQIRRETKRQKDKNQSNLIKGFAIESEIKTLLRTDDEIKTALDKKEQERINGRTLQLNRRIEDLRRIGISRKTGKLRPSYKREIEHCEQELNNLSLRA